MASQDIINLQNLCSPHCLLVVHFLLADRIQQLDQDCPQTCGTPGTLHTVHAMYVRPCLDETQKNFAMESC